MNLHAVSPHSGLRINCFQFILQSSSHLSSLSAFASFAFGGKCLYSILGRLRLFDQSLYMPLPVGFRLQASGFRQDCQHSINDCTCQSQGFLSGVLQCPADGKRVHRRCRLFIHASRLLQQLEMPDQECLQAAATESFAYRAAMTQDQVTVLCRL